MTAARFIRSTFLLNVGLAALTALGCLLIAGSGLALAAGLGGLLGSANVLVLGLLAARMLGGGRGRLAMTGLLVLKMGALIGLAFLAIGVFAVSSLGLILGVSTTVAALLVMSVLVAARGGAVEP